MFLTLIVVLLASLAPAAQGSSSSTPTAVPVLLTLTEESASRVFARVKAESTLSADEAAAAAKTAAAAQAGRVKQQQDRILDALKQQPYRASLIYRLDRNTNAIAVRIDSRFVPQLRKLAGVRSVALIATDVTTPKKSP